MSEEGEIKYKFTHPSMVMIHTIPIETKKYRGSGKPLDRRYSNNEKLEKTKEE